MDWLQTEISLEKQTFHRKFPTRDYFHVRKIKIYIKNKYIPVNKLLKKNKYIISCSDGKEQAALELDLNITDFLLVKSVEWLEELSSINTNLKPLYEGYGVKDVSALSEKYGKIGEIYYQSL